MSDNNNYQNNTQGIKIDKSTQETVFKTESNLNEVNEGNLQIDSNDPWNGTTPLDKANENLDINDLIPFIVPRKLSKLKDVDSQTTEPRKLEQKTLPGIATVEVESTKSAQRESISQPYIREIDAKEIPCVFKPSQILLDNWKIWIGIKIIRQLKDGSFDRNNDYFELPEIALAEKFSPVYKLLEDKSIQLRNRIDVNLTLSQAKTELETYYFKTITFEVQKLAQDPDLTDVFAMKETFYLKGKSIRPKTMVSLMQSMANELLVKKNIVQAKERECIDMEHSACQAYINIIQKDLSNKIDSSWSAVTMSLKSKLEALECNTIARLYSDAIGHCNLYHKYARKSLKILDEIECSLQKKLSLDLMCLPNMSRIDIDEQQKLLELWIGHFINHWAIAPVTSLSIEEKLLDNLDEIAQLVFRDFCRQFMEYVVIEESC